MGPDATARRVLVVDDTSQIRLLIRLNLELEGYAVEEAGDGAGALARLRDRALPRVDVVTIDATMPVLDGWSAVAAMRADPASRDIPVVMITASVQAQHRARAENAGVQAFIAKPFDPDVLVATLATVLGTLAQ